MRRSSPFVLALLVVLAAPAAGVMPPDGVDTATWSAWQLAALPRAIAVSPGGTIAWHSDPDETAATVREAALDACRARAGEPCRIMVEGLGPPPDPAVRSTPDAPLAQGMGWSIEPDPRFHWRGPGASRGALVWTHGTGPPGNTYTGQQPPPWTRAFNLAGWDVLRFDRFPALTQGAFDGDERLARRDVAGHAARVGLARVREAGYARTVVAGFSAGAWILLHAMREPGLADAVVLVSAASHGPRPGERRLRQLAELEALAEATKPQALRLAVVQFEDDPFLEQPERRASIFRERFGKHLASVLVLDRPPGFATHGGEDDPGFAPRFGPCLVAFASLPDPPSACP